MKQSDFSFGVVDPALHSATDAPQYLQAFSVGDNLLVNSKRQVTKRPGTEFIYRTDAPIAVGGLNVKSLGFETKEGKWYQCLLYVDEGFLFALIKSFENERVTSETNKTVSSYFGNVENVSMTATDEYIVITNVNFHPKRIDVKTPLTSSTVSDINFSVLPSITSDEIDYSNYTFTPSGNPMGSTMTVTMPAGSAQFDANWVGGLLIDQFGLSTDNPLGYGLISSIQTPNNTTQVIGLTVLTAFANRVAPGDVISVRKPAWSANNWPSLCLFYQSRLWLFGTKEKSFFVAASHENQPNNFNVGTGRPSDAIGEIMSNTSGGGIKKVFGGHNLHIWTDQAQIIIPSGMDVGITSASFSTPQVSAYRCSKMEPLQYRNNIYFTTSTGKAVIEVVETQGESASADLSFSAEHLINNPIKAQVTVEDDTQEQYLYFLNNDNTITAFSKSEISNVNAFTLLKMEMPTNEQIVSIDTIDNTLYGTVRNLDTGHLMTLKFSSNAYLDCYSECIFSNNSSPVWAIYNNNTVSIVKDDGNKQFSYIGDALVTDGILNFNIEDGHYLIGKIYNTAFKSMPLFLNKLGSFYKKNIFQIYIEYYQSYNFTVNGKVTATASFADSNKPKTPKTGGCAIRLRQRVPR